MRSRGLITEDHQSRLECVGTAEHNNSTPRDQKVDSCELAQQVVNTNQNSQRTYKIWGISTMTIGDKGRQTANKQTVLLHQSIIRDVHKKNCSYSFPLQFTIYIPRRYWIRQRYIKKPKILYTPTLDWYCQCILLWIGLLPDRNGAAINSGGEGAAII